MKLEELLLLIKNNTNIKIYNNNNLVYTTNTIQDDLIERGNYNLKYYLEYRIADVEVDSDYKDYADTARDNSCISINIIR